MATKQSLIARAERCASASQELRDSRRAQIPLRDLSECLLAAYEGVSQRAFRLHRARAADAGSELEVWKQAERELLGAMPVDLAESEENFYALASVPGYAAAEISVAVEDSWLLISGYGHSVGEAESVVGGVECDLTGVMGPYGEASAADLPRKNVAWRSALPSNACVDPSSGDCVVRRPFCVVELGRKVDASRSIAVVANGMVAVRMAKADSRAPTRREKARE